MRKRRKGGLIQSTKLIKDEEYIFRIISIEPPSKVKIVGKYTSLNKAKKVIDSLGNVNIDYYLENINSNRVLYSKIGNPPNGKL
tara:strand:+ start:340 stop:591 length:252 start_codon:yes stop_codon:yes gene_type:complete